MGETASTVLELGLHAQHQQGKLITTGRFDAVLPEPPPERTQQTIGRPRVGGLRLPALEQVLPDPEEEGRAHLGIETQRQWSDLATLRSTPLLFGLSSLVTFFGQAVHPDGCVPVARVGLVSQTRGSLP
jgi:hypothetical protein